MYPVAPSSSRHSGSRTHGGRSVTYLYHARHSSARQRNPIIHRPLASDSSYRSHTQILHSQAYSAIYNLRGRASTLGTRRPGAHHRLQATPVLRVRRPSQYSALAHFQCTVRTLALRRTGGILEVSERASFVLGEYDIISSGYINASVD